MCTFILHVITFIEILVPHKCSAKVGFRDGSEHMLARCSLGARSVLGLFYGARARGLKSEHMLVLARARG